MNVGICRERIIRKVPSENMASLRRRKYRTFLYVERPSSCMCDDEDGETLKMGVPFLTTTT